MVTVPTTSLSGVGDSILSYSHSLAFIIINLRTGNKLGMFVDQIKTQANGMHNIDLLGEKFFFSF